MTAVRVRSMSARGPGSGFLLFRPSDPEQNVGQVFLVTNKHVIADYDGDQDTANVRTMRHAAESVTLGLNERTYKGLRGVDWHCRLRESDGTPRWREHPDENVDVFIVNLTAMLDSHRPLQQAAFYVHVEFLGLRATRERFHIAVGEDVLVAGYPLGLRQGSTNHPLLRQGMIATRPGEPLEELDDHIEGLSRVSRAFLVDGAMLPGSSGSPVFLKPSMTPGLLVYGKTRPWIVLLGILAETRFAMAKQHWSYANLGLVQEAETIQETLDLFPPPSDEP